MTESQPEPEARQTSAKSLRDQVHEWIERQGYPLEMTVANAFTQRGPVFVEQSKYYRDSTTGEIREADVVAIYSGILPGEGGKAWLTAYVVVECKGGSAPWIIFRTSEGLAEYDQDTALRMLPSVGMDHERFARMMHRALTSEPTLLTARFRPGYAIAEKRNHDKDKSGIDKAYEAVRQASSAVWGILSELDEAPYDRSEHPAVAIPVVVKRGSLFTCQLDEKGQLTVDEVERSAVTVRTSAGTQPIVVHVVTLPSIDALVEDCLATFEGLCIPSSSPPTAAGQQS